jgi:hypothetical protein
MRGEISFRGVKTEESFRMNWDEKGRDPKRRHSVAWGRRTDRLTDGARVVDGTRVIWAGLLDFLLLLQASRHTQPLYAPARQLHRARAISQEGSGEWPTGMGSWRIIWVSVLDLIVSHMNLQVPSRPADYIGRDHLSLETAITSTFRNCPEKVPSDALYTHVGSSLVVRECWIQLSNNNSHCGILSQNRRLHHRYIAI